MRDPSKKLEALSDPDVKAKLVAGMDRRRHARGSGLGPGDYVIRDVALDANKRPRRAQLDDIAARAWHAAPASRSSTCPSTRTSGTWFIRDGLGHSDSRRRRRAARPPARARRRERRRRPRRLVRHVRRHRLPALARSCARPGALSLEAAVKKITADPADDLGPARVAAGSTAGLRRRRRRVRRRHHRSRPRDRVRRLPRRRHPLDPPLRRASTTSSSTARSRGPPTTATSRTPAPASWRRRSPKSGQDSLRPALSAYDGPVVRRVRPGLRGRRRTRPSRGSPSGRAACHSWVWVGRVTAVGTLPTQVEPSGGSPAGPALCQTHKAGRSVCSHRTTRRRPAPLCAARRRRPNWAATTSSRSVVGT